ncbi:retrovirus-related pol polyprotein from transposon TNT 1-94 [Tanacetum coccineum]|uniref:Retrovirus-related pol polyprotein from transposon TNT 1-94 n=1 Tax=Tanacetum coccineum TaxID=301880 RepID=A0ABQ4Z8T8_9ASTR
MYPPPHLSQLQISHSSVPPSQQYQSHQTLFVPPIAYNSPQSLTQPLTEFPQMDSGLAFLMFNQGDDPIAYLNKAMAFLIAIASSRVTVQQVQGRQRQSYVGTGYKSNATSSEGNNAGGQARVVKCYNCQGKGHMARQCTQSKRPRNTEDLDAYDFDYDDVSNAKAVLMANLSNYDSDVISEEKANQEKNNESLTAKLERYKERVKTFEQRLNIDLSTREKMIDSQMDDMIKEKLALKQKIYSLEQNLSNQIKEKESLLQTFTVFKNESKEKESKYMDKEIDLEKKIKELDNIVYKVGQSTQTVHIVISSQHVVSPVIDDEEALILEEVSRSKMLAKQNDPMSKEKKVDTTPINYVELNRISEYFGKIKAHKELPKVSLVNTSLKKLRYHLGQFNIMVKKRITPDAIIEGEWGFEHTKTIFLNEIIPFLKTLKDIFNVFDKDFLNEVTEVQIVFNQMEADVQQYFIEKQCFEIHKKEPFLENDRLLQKLMSQDVVICVMKSTAVFDDVNVEIHSTKSYVRCLDLDVELLNKQNVYNDLSKRYSQLEKH